MISETSDSPQQGSLRMHVEVRLRGDSVVRPDSIRSRVLALFEGSSNLNLDEIEFESDLFLSENVECIRTCEGADRLTIHVYQLHDAESCTVLDTEDDAEMLSVSTTSTNLPSPVLEGLWESLVFDNNVLSKLLNYVSTSILFAEKCINPHIISFNKVVLLHGPPGTGKTSLCRALAQKLSIRLADRYCSFQLVEINSHSLFSKFFSESGKLVMKMFQSIKDLCENPDVFVCVLIDEVESLTAARKAACSGMEPSDAIRVVNALLTQIDALKRKKNVLILTTSNITEAIDVAFIDRADLKLFIGLPSKHVIHSILNSTLSELMRCGLIAPEVPIPFPHDVANEDECEIIDIRSSESRKMLGICEKCVGLSGRAVRKMPFLAHALFIQSDKPSNLSDFLSALELAVTDEHGSRNSM